MIVRIGVKDSFLLFSFKIVIDFLFAHPELQAGIHKQNNQKKERDRDNPRIDFSPERSHLFGVQYFFVR